MAKELNSLQKCMIVNKALQALQQETIKGGETITVVIETKKNGDMKNFTVERSEK